MAVAWLCLLAAGGAFAAEENANGVTVSEGERLFVNQVKPMLNAKCLACHGDDEKGEKGIKGELDLRTREKAMTPGESGEPSLVPGKVDDSLMFLAVTWKDPDLQMPPKENDRLSAKQIAALKRWIELGAPWPDEDRANAIRKASWAEASTKDGVLVATSGGLGDEWTYRRYKPEALWAYQPVQNPAPPKALDAAGKAPRHAIDAFVLARLNAASITPAPRADKRTLIRRATYDLTGLPPSPKEVDAFLADASPDAYAKLIDRLLASPHYGERMAQFWLDVVRYADTSGFSNDHVRPNAWRYRDYVVRAFNQDKPYDRFVIEQLAGDELNAQKPAKQHDPELAIAVGFLRTGPWEHTAMSVAAVTRQQFLDDVTNSVGVVFLGHELRCAKCHDHKFDPIPTRDYYRMQAIFASVAFTDAQTPFLKQENLEGLDEHAKRIAMLQKLDAVKSLESIPKSEWPVKTFDKRTDGIGRGKVNGKRRQYLKRETNRAKPLAFSVKSNASDKTFILTGGSIESPSTQVTPGLLSVVEAMQSPAKHDPRAAATIRRDASVTGNKAGRRLELAKWIASKANPLTARVMVNRIWQHHFGRGIAANPNNLGGTGARPTHPLLLDHLATWFVDPARGGWSIKKLHRYMMLSDAYQRASQHAQLDTLMQKDPDNKLLWRYTPRRLTAEELRDSMLVASGELNRKMGGIPARPEMNMEVAMQPRHIMGSVAPAYQPHPLPHQRHRRTIYAERIRTLRDPMLEVFNLPGFDTSAESRDASTVATQAFTLFNSQQTADRALAMAVRLKKEAGDDRARVVQAFRLSYGRTPSSAEIDACLKHVDAMTATHKSNPPVKVQPPKYVIRSMVEEMTGLDFYWVETLDIYQDSFVPDTKPWDVDARTRAWADLCLVLMNSNEFVYVY